MVVHRRGAMFDIAKIAARQPLPPGPRVRFITNSHDPGPADGAHRRAPSACCRTTPPVLLGSVADPEAFRVAALEALADPTCDSVVCAAVNVFDKGTEDVIEALEGVAQAAEQAAGRGVPGLPPPQRASPTGSDAPGALPRFDAAADAIQALSALTAYAHWRDRDTGRRAADGGRHRRPPSGWSTGCSARRADRPRADRRRRPPSCCRRTGSGWCRAIPVASLDEAVAVADGLGWNVVLKATAEAVRGRPDLASVYRNINGPRRWPTPGRTCGTSSATSGMQRRPRSDRGRAGGAGDGPARRRAGRHQPGGRRLRTDHLARPGRHPQRAARRHRLSGAAADHRRRGGDGARPARRADAVRSARQPRGAMCPGSRTCCTGWP